MNTRKKRVVSLYIALFLILSFSLQTLATDESQVLTQEPMTEGTVSELSIDLLELSIGQSLVVDEEKPQLEPDLKPDPKLDEVSLDASGQEEKPQLDTDSKLDHKPDEVTLGASGQEEKPAAGPTITPFTTAEFTFLSDGMGPYRAPNATQYDLATKISFLEHIYQTLEPEWVDAEVGGKSEYNINGGAYEIYALGNNDLGEDIDLTFLGEGRHILIFRKYATIEKDPPDWDTAFVYINIVNTTAAPEVRSTYKNVLSIPVNPTALALSHTGATAPDTLAQSGGALTYEWQIVRDSDLNTIDSGTMIFDKDGSHLFGAAPSTDILNGLETGGYTLRQKSVATTRHGNHTGHGEKLPKDVANFDTVSWIDVPFIIVKPAPETLINDGTTDVTNPTEIDPVTSPTKITVNSKYPLHSEAPSRDDETQASAVTWELFKSDGVGGWDSQGPAVSFDDGKNTADVALPSGFGDYKVVVSETIAGVPGTAEGYFSFPSSFVAVQYWIDDGSGTLKSSETWTSPVAWPSKTEGKPNASQATIGMTIPQDYELIRVEEVLTDGTINDKGKDNNSYGATYPADRETTIIKYVYKEKGSLVLLSAPSLQFGTHKMASTTMIYPLAQEAVLSVQDDRAIAGNWKVSVKASMLTEVNGTRTLDPDALGFMDNGEFVSLKESRIVWKSSTIPTNPTQNITWQEGNAGVGFVVNLLPFQASAISYNAVMRWSLENTP